MTLGTGIFASSVLIFLVALFIATKDSWNWTKTFKWLFGGVVTLALIGIMVSVGMLWLISRPKVQNEFWGLSFQNTPRDVRFFKGIPHYVEREKVVEACKCDSMYLYIYIDKENDAKNRESFLVGFKNGNLTEVDYSCRGTPKNNLEIQSIGIFSNMNDVQKKFGKPSEVIESKNGLVRTWYYADYRVSFSFEKSTVFSMGIYTPGLSNR